MQTKKNSILLLILSLWVILLTPWTFTQGIFVDGLYYGTIARNWYFEGTGYWDFYLTKTQFNPFCSHPPFAFWLQGMLFSIVGDVWYCDRLYALCMAILSGIAIIKIWNLFYKSDGTWLPLFCWLLIPTVLWSFNNNLLENTVTAACTWAVFLALSAEKQPKTRLLNYIGVAFFTFLGLLTKGPVAAFPLIIPFISFYYHHKKLTWASLLSLIIPGLTVSLLFSIMFYFSTEAQDYFQAYWQLQVVGSLSGANPISTSRFFILFRLLEELAILAIFVLLLFLYQMRKPYGLSISSFLLNKQSGLFLFIALSASLPLLISPKQMSFYIVPSTPFWALTAASLLFKSVDKWVSNPTLFFRKAGRRIAASLLLVGLSLSIFNYKSYARDKEKLEAISEISKIVPEKTRLDMSYSLYKEWSLYGYFYRLRYISLEATGKPIGPYYLLKKGEKIKLKGYQEIELNTSAAAVFRLYKQG